jgi:uncharacterized protein YuzE
MKITYDSTTNAAYVQLSDEIGAGGVESTYACDPSEVGGMIHLDFNREGILVGIEVLGARGKLPRELLELAEGFER